MYSYLFVYFALTVHSACDGRNKKQTRGKNIQRHLETKKKNRNWNRNRNIYVLRYREVMAKRRNREANTDQQHPKLMKSRARSNGTWAKFLLTNVDSAKVLKSNKANSYNQNKNSKSNKINNHLVEVSPSWWRQTLDCAKRRRSFRTNYSVILQKINI